EVRDRVRGAARRRSAGPPAGYLAGPRDPRLGAPGEPARGPAAHAGPGRGCGVGGGLLGNGPRARIVSPATPLLSDQATVISRTGADVGARTQLDGRAERGREHPFERDARARSTAPPRAGRSAQEAAILVVPAALGDAAPGRPGHLAARARL